MRKKVISSLFLAFFLWIAFRFSSSGKPITAVTRSTQEQLTLIVGGNLILKRLIADIIVDLGLSKPVVILENELEANLFFPDLYFDVCTVQSNDACWKRISHGVSVALIILDVRTKVDLDFIRLCADSGAFVVLLSALSVYSKLSFSLAETDSARDASQFLVSEIFLRHLAPKAGYTIFRTAPLASAREIFAINYDELACIIAHSGTIPSMRNEIFNLGRKRTSSDPYCFDAVECFFTLPFFSKLDAHFSQDKRLRVIRRLDRRFNRSSMELAQKIYTHSQVNLRSTNRKIAKRNVELVIIVPSVVSSTTSFEGIEMSSSRRFFFRRQFRRLPKLLQDRSALFFVYGAENMRKLAVEEVSSNDFLFVQCTDLDTSRDDYLSVKPSSATCKVHEAMRWAASNLEFKYLARVGDDSYINVHEFFRILISLPLERLYLGRFSRGMAMTEPWSSRFGTSVWPEYAVGMGYIVSQDVVQHIAASLLPLRMTSPEDGMVGAWLYGVEILRIDDTRFHDIRRGSYKGPCLSSDILVHYMTDADWENINENGTLRC